MNYPNPIIFIHGIQGAWLKDHYPVDYQDEIYWSGIMKKKFGKLHLSSINQTVDSDIDRFIFPHQAVAFVYESIVDELREEWRREQAARQSSPHPATPKKPGRNDPCPCGSGKKFKKCCGGKTASS